MARVGMVRIEPTGTLATRTVALAALLQIERRVLGEKEKYKALIEKETSDVADLFGMDARPGHVGWTGGRGRDAATCRKAKALSWQPNPEVAEECLSFVIPGQQGRAGNRGEVH